MAVFVAMGHIHFDSEWLTLAVNTLLLLVYVAVVLYNERTLVRRVLGKLGIKRG